MRTFKHCIHALTAVLTIQALTSVPVASACSVCFGSQDDPMVQGAANGVLFMVVVTYAMLLGMGAFAATWFVRARRTRIGSAEAMPPETK